MRWFWIDRFLEFRHGERAVAEKTVCLAGDPMRGHFPGCPIMPRSLTVEGMAQTGGLLVAEYNHFHENVVLAKISKAVFHTAAVAGDVIRYTAVLEDMSADGAMISGRCYIGNELHAEIELWFAHLSEADFQGDLFDPADFLVMLRILGIYDVGMTPGGSLLAVPEHLLAAEAEAQAAASS